MTKADGRVPVIASADEFSIPWQTLQTIIAGRSLIDTLELQVANLDEARRFPTPKHGFRHTTVFMTIHHTSKVTIKTKHLQVVSAKMTNKD